MFYFIFIKKSIYSYLGNNTIRTIPNELFRLSNLKFL